MSEDRGALSRWSRRKAAARRGETPAEPTERDETNAARPIADTPAVAQSDSGADERPVLPPIEELTAQSDYTAFLAEKVPEHLQRAALRKLWNSDPVFANLDGLNHYDEDYNVVDTTISAAQTAYRAGIGYVEQIETAIDRVEDALGNPAVPKIESINDVTTVGSDVPSAAHSKAGDKFVDASQQTAPSSAAANADEKSNK